MRECITKILAKDEQFFIKSRATFTVQEALPCLSNCLGLIINFTASRNQEFAKLLIDKKIVEVIFEALNFEVDLVRREQAVWALRNLSQNKDTAQKIASHKSFAKIVYELILSKVTNIVDMTVALVKNVVEHVPSSHLLLYPS